MTSYRQEQAEGFRQVLAHLENLGREGRRALHASASDYLDFRRRTAAFLQAHFSGVCTRSCYHSRRSACCSKDGIVTFFADLVVNALVSDLAGTARILARLERPHEGFKCIYLGVEGCLWAVKPVVCEMFLCDAAMDEVFSRRPDLREAWEGLQREKKRYSWPDRPVLFDDLEKVFIQRGADSSLMYMHKSPGLLRVKRLAGLDDPKG